MVIYNLHRHRRASAQRGICSADGRFHFRVRRINIRSVDQLGRSTVHIRFLRQVSINERCHARRVIQARIHVRRRDAVLAVAGTQTCALCRANLPVDNRILAWKGAGRICLLRNVNHAESCLFVKARGTLIKATQHAIPLVHERVHVELHLRTKVSEDLWQVRCAKVEASRSAHAIE